MPPDEGSVPGLARDDDILLVSCCAAGFVRRDPETEKPPPPASEPLPCDDGARGWNSSGSLKPLPSCSVTIRMPGFTGETGGLALASDDAELSDL